MPSKTFSPMILETKEELRLALKQGKLVTAKYNLLSESEKQFVDLVCFGGYTGEQAVRALNPGVKNPYAIANQVMSNPDVVEAIDELTIAKDTKFKSEISSARDMALSKLQYIMINTKDEALAASCAKIILDKAEAAVKESKKDDKEEPVSQVKFNIQVENLYNGCPSPKNEEPVIIPLTEAEATPVESVPVPAGFESNAKPDGSMSVNPETGMPYVLHYEGVDNYNDKEDK